MFRIVHNLRQTIQVGKQQVCTLVGSETTAETNHQRIGVDLLQQRQHTRGIALVLQPVLTELHTDIIGEFLLQHDTCLPDFLIGHIIDGMPDFLITLVTHEVGIEILLIEMTPLRSSPRREVNTVGDVAHGILLGEIALPDGRKHLLRHPTVEFTYTVHLLTGVDGEGGHRELLSLIVGVRATHADELIPRDTELCRISAHVLAEEGLVEVVVTGGHRRMTGVETAGTHQFHSLVEGETFLDVVHQTLQVAECGMSLVTVIDILLDTEFLQCEHTADTQQDFLLQTVFPVATIQRVRDGFVELGVHFIITIKQIQFDTTYIHTPYIGMHLVVDIGHIHNHRRTVLVELALDGQRMEVLCVIDGNLLTVHRQTLLEVTVAIQETHGTHIHVGIGSLLQIVTG